MHNVVHVNASRPWIVSALVQQVAQEQGAAVPGPYPARLWLAAGEAPAQVQAEQVEGGSHVVGERGHQQDVLSTLRGTRSSAVAWRRRRGLCAQ